LRISLRSKPVFLIIGISIIVILVEVPFIAGTSAYPLAIVNGNSMYPNLHNGDLVFFRSSPDPIKNGTVIVFIQSETGVGVLDSLLKPIVIHRIIGIGHEPSGMIYYQTKGDNNIGPDPFVTDENNVLGVPVFVIPYAGLPFQFLQTAFGMVTISAIATLYFLSGIDSKMEQATEKKRLVALFAGHSLNGEISPRQFEKLQLAVEFYDDVSLDLLSDHAMISTIDWLRAGGLSTKWKEERVPCPDCKTSSFCIMSGDHSFLICPGCSNKASGQSPE
jgi:signal peptidase I